MNRVVTYSELACMALCPKKHEFQYEKRLSPKSRSIYLDESSAVHRAFERYYKGASEAKSIEAFDEAFQAHLTMLVGAGKDTFEAVSRFQRIRALVIAYFRLVGRKDRKAYRFDHVEEEFCVPILPPGGGKALPGVVFAGKIDGIWTQKSGRKIKSVVEHKCLSSFDEYENTLSMDLQVTLYALAAKATFGVEIPITLYNVCRKPMNKMGKDEKPEEFSSRMLDLILGDPDSYFCRVPVTRGRIHFREAERLIWHGARILTGETPLPYAWRNVGRHCRFLCSYRELCIEESPNMTSRLFEVREKPHEELSLAEA